MAITLPSTDINGDTFTIHAKGIDEGKVIETSSQLQIAPITEVFSLNGMITDAPIAEADITFNILNSDRKIQATADSNGLYQTDIILDDDEPSLIYIEALGKQNQSNAKLVRMIGDLRESKKNNPQEELKYNVTNLTTAEYALAKEINNGETFSSYQNYIEQAEEIDENTLLDVATIIKVIIDEPIKTPQTMLPSSVSDTLELVTKKDKREAFLYNVINTSQFSNAKKQMLADKEVISSQFDLPVGEHYFIPINNHLAGFVLNLNDNSATLSSSTEMVDKIDVSKQADTVVIKAVSELGLSLENLRGGFSDQDGFERIDFCGELVIRQLYTKKNNALVNVSANCSDDLGNTIALTSQLRLYRADNTTYKTQSAVTQHLTQRHKLTLIQPPCHHQPADCSETFALTFNEEKEAFQLGDKTVNWNEEDQTLFLRDDIELRFLHFLSERVDYVIQSNDRIYPASGRLLENRDNNAQGDLSGDYVVLNESNKQQQSFLSMKQNGEAILWFVDSSAETLTSGYFTTKYLANWVRNQEQVTFNIIEIQEINDNERVTYRAEQCHNENNCEKFANLIWDINGYVNDKIHLEQQARPTLSSNLVEPTHFTLVPTENIDAFEAINQWHQWQGTDLPTPWTLFQTAQKNKNKESLTQLIPTLPGLESLSFDYLDDYINALVESAPIESLEQLQSHLTRIEQTRRVHDDAIRSIFNRRDQSSILTALHDLTFDAINPSFLEEYANEILRTQEINSETELVSLIEAVNQKLMAEQTAWEAIRLALTLKDATRIDTTVLSKIQGLEFNDANLEAYIKQLMLLDTTPDLNALQQVIVQVDQTQLKFETAWATLNAAVRQQDFSKVSSETLADLKTITFDADHLADYLTQLSTLNEIDDLAQLQSVIDAADEKINRHNSAWSNIQSAIENNDQTLITPETLNKLNDFYFVDENVSHYRIKLAEITELTSVAQLQQIIDEIDAKRLRHATAWDVIERAVINKDMEALKIQTLYDIDTLIFKEENFTDYLEAITNSTLLNNVEELQQIIDNIDSEKTLFLQTWQMLQDAWSSKNFSNITEDTIKPLKLYGIIGEHFNDYLNSIAQLENLEQLTQIQTVIDNVNQDWLAHNQAISSINEAINNSEFSGITSDTFADLIDFQYIEDNIEKYKERLSEQNPIESIEALQELIFNVDVDNAVNDTSSDPEIWNEGIFFPSELYLNRCASPREGIDPFTNQNYPDILGSSLDEKLYLRSIHHEEYFWYDEINDTDPNSYPSTLSYFSSLKTPATLDNNLAKDRFHFSQTYEQYMSGFIERVVYGFGFNWSFLSATAPRNLVLSYVDENSVASMAGVARGDKLVKINSIDVVNTNVYDELNYINETLFNPRDILYQFEFQSPSGELKTVLLNPTNETVSPVMHVKQLSQADNRIGYFMLNEFHASAQTPLISAFNDFYLNGVSDLIIDLRYNQGGLLYMASQLAYMIAGGNSLNRVFESLIYNDKNADKNLNLYFMNREIDWDQGVITNNILPTLNLERVFILATGATASASESLINGLRGIDVEVILIGEQTYGKPYGFLPNMNCGMVYYFVQFVGQNEKGYGHYAYGLVPIETEPSEMGLSHQVQGCPVADDLNFLLGTPEEPMINNALNIMSQNQCVSTSSNVTDIQTSNKFIVPSAPSSSQNQKIFKKLYTTPPWL
ncbi:hypothetical protein BTO00_08775 [Vibrio campbellii]|nr:hypothetical protein BTO00_08775 [Vibrio campbellii]